MKKNRFWAIIAVFLFSAGCAEALTLLQLRNEIRRNLRDTSSSSDDQRYSDATLNEYINEAQREVVNIGWLSEKTTEYTLLPRTTYYSLPNDCINVFEVKFKKSGTSQFIVLDPTSFEELRRTMPSWESTPGTPVKYYIDQSTQSQATSSSSLVISYIPIAAALSTGTVVVRYYNMVDDLVNDGDIPFNAKRYYFTYHMMLAYHATMRIKMIEGLVAEATYYQGLFNNAIAIMRDKVGRNPGYYPGFGVATK